MKKYVLIFLVAMLILPQLSNAQTAVAPWKSYRTELIFGFGTNNFMGDLGGGSKDGGHYFASARDIDFAKTRPTAYLGIRYKLLERVAIRGNVAYARVAGDDANSGYWTRQMRNLSFRSDVYEFSGMLELSILKNYTGRRYLFTSPNRSKINLYLFGGVGIFHFNPKAQIAGEGEWYELQPLGTEGQGVKTDESGNIIDKYSLWEISIPVGLGMRYYLNKQWAVGVEIGNRFTTTDYLDDVSTDYYIYHPDPSIARALADKHINVGPDGGIIPGIPDAGQLLRGKRGTTDYNDAFLFMTFTLSYTFNKAYKGGPKYNN